MPRPPPPPRAPTFAERTLIEKGLDQRFEAAMTQAEELHNKATGFGSLAIVVGLAYCAAVPIRGSFIALIGAAVTLAAGPVIALVGMRRSSRGQTEALAQLGKERAIRLANVTDWQFWARRIVLAADNDAPTTTWWLFELEPDEWLAFHQSHWGAVDPSTVEICAFNQLAIDGSGTVLSFESSGGKVPLERRTGDGTPAVGSEGLLLFSAPTGAMGAPVSFDGDPTKKRDTP